MTERQEEQAALNALYSLDAHERQILKFLAGGGRRQGFGFLFLLLFLGFPFKNVTRSNFLKIISLIS